jgi:hypothetical protein
LSRPTTSGSGLRLRVSVGMGGIIPYAGEMA